LLKSAKPSIGLELLRASGLMQLFLPELVATKEIQQAIGHSFDVYQHLLRTTDLAPDRVKLAALFHDIAKPETATNDGHFYGHDQTGAELTEKIMRRLKFSNLEIKSVSNLVRWHMFYYPYNEKELQEINKTPTSEFDVTEAAHTTSEAGHKEDIKEVKFWSDGAVRRFIRRVGLENIEDLFALRIADATSEPLSMWSPEEIVALQARISKVLEQDNALKIADLAINGQDLMTVCSLPPGELIGKTLNFLLEQVLENPNLNGKEELLSLAKEFIARENT